MRLFFILSILFMSQGFASRNIGRQKRDLLAIRNFVCNLFGLNYNLPMRRFILRRPINGNIYRVLNDDDFYISTIPDFTLSNMRLDSSQQRAPVYEVNDYKLDNKHDYKIDNSGDYLKEIKLPNEKKPISTEELSKERDADLSDVANKKKVLPYRPLYIQNRLDKLKTPITYLATDKIEKPVIPSSYNTFFLPRNSGEVHVNKFPLVRTSYKDSTFVKQKLNSSTISSRPLSPLNDFVGMKPTLVTQTTTPEINERTRLKINLSETPKKEVKFTEHVPSKYSYKNVYHMQPDKNTVIKFDNTMSSPTVQAQSSTSVPSMDSNRDFFLVPPFTDIDPPLAVNKVKTYKDNNEKKGIVQKTPTVEQAYTNKQDDEVKPIRSFEQRGDIPSFFLQYD